MDELSMLRRYLQQSRDALLAKVDGLSERQARLPLTGTGLSLAGLLKHTANTEIGYLGTCFGRDWPTPDDPLYVTDEAFEADPQADFTLGREQSLADLVDFARRAWAFADTNLTELAAGPDGLDTMGRVPWWRAGAITLRQAIVHTSTDEARHAGHADILRESLDGSAGLVPGNENLPELDWAAHRERMQQLADSFADEAQSGARQTR